ncbi:MAG TPA: DMT family transporter [Patescibacteria group bacterium]|nr:DMT family transporter [Patescibacteria group bacterium]
MDPVSIILTQNTAAAVFAVVSRKLSPALPRAYFQVNAIVIGIMYFAGLAWAAVHRGVSVAELLQWLPWLLGGSLAFAMTNAISFKVFQYVDAAIASLLSTFNIIAAIILSTIFIGEGLTLRNALGAAIILGAAWLVLSAHVGRQERRAWTIGLALSLLAAVFFGIAITNEKFLLNHMGLSSYLVWGWGVQVIVAFVCSFVFMPRGYRDIAKVRPYGLLGMAGALRAISGLTFVLALVRLNNLAIVSALSGLKVILAAAFGLVFLHEGQFAVRKISASLAAAAGVAIMFWK